MAKVTIVTICFNEEKTISKTIESVLNQTYSDFEYIIKDGNSSDHTNEIIRKYCEKFKNKGIEFIHLIGEDNGIYSAMNIAVAESKGEWINFMNAGDSFYNNNVLNDIFQTDQWAKSDILYGHTLLELENGGHFVQLNDHNNLVNGEGICQQVCFVRSNLVKEVPFCEQYKILADYDFLIKMLFSGIIFSPINNIVANYNRKGISSKEVYQSNIEKIKILKKYVKVKEIGVKARIILKIKTLFSKYFPLLSDFLFCYHRFYK